MSKQFVDQMIAHMKLAGIVTKATPWMVEGTTSRTEGTADKQMNVRYVGIRFTDADWQDIIPANNNILVKFVIDRSSAYIEWYIANTPPFTRFTSRQFVDGDKWETIFGDTKRKLKRDKADYINHAEQVGNLYTRIVKQLK